jgi:hypothetical protein
VEDFYDSLLALRADVELLSNPPIPVLGVLQQDLFNGPLEAALLFPKLGASPLTPLPVRPKLGFA